MSHPEAVREILSYYESDNPGTKANIARILNTGRLAGTGKLVILPVDQGFEHGPVRSFSYNQPAFDPTYFYQLALEAGCNAYAAPLGLLENGAAEYAGLMPLILKMNSANSLAPGDLAPDQAVTGSVEDALRLGCSAVGLTIYPGSGKANDMIEEAREAAAEAKKAGLAVVIWSYPRGGDLSKDGETAIDVVSYGAHMAALLGAHIIKVKLPTSHVEQKKPKQAYDDNTVELEPLSQRVNLIKQACFNGRRLVVFSGGSAKGADGVYEDARAIRDGGGNGTIIGRNSFQRPKDEAVDMLTRIMRIYGNDE